MSINAQGFKRCDPGLGGSLNVLHVFGRWEAPARYRHGEMARTALTARRTPSNTPRSDMVTARFSQPTLMAKCRSTSSAPCVAAAWFPVPVTWDRGRIMDSAAKRSKRRHQHLHRADRLMPGPARTATSKPFFLVWNGGRPALKACLPLLRCEAHLLPKLNVLAAPMIQ